MATTFNVNAPAYLKPGDGMPSTGNYLFGDFDTQPLEFFTFSQTIDIAAIGQPLSAVAIEDNMHVISLDTIGAITVEEFRTLFYYTDGEIFGVNPAALLDASATSLISFLGDDRTMNGGDVSFNLTEAVFENLEADLGVKRECFDLCTKIELTKELSRINTLVDIESCVVLCSLKWSDVKRILLQKGQQLGQDLAGATVTNSGVCKNGIQHMLVVSVIFKNPNVKTKDLMIRFKYAVIFCDDDL